MQTKATGFVLITPTGAIWAETFRPTRDAAKGWLAMQKMSDGRYHDWKHYYRAGWRCKPATVELVEPSNVQIEAPSRPLAKVASNAGLGLAPGKE